MSPHRNGCGQIRAGPREPLLRRLRRRSRRVREGRTMPSAQSFSGFFSDPRYLPTDTELIDSRQRRRRPMPRNDLIHRERRFSSWRARSAPSLARFVSGGLGRGMQATSAYLANVHALLGSVSDALDRREHTERYHAIRIEDLGHCRNHEEKLNTGPENLDTGIPGRRLAEAHRPRGSRHSSR